MKLATRTLVDHIGARFALRSIAVRPVGCRFS